MISRSPIAMLAGRVRLMGGGKAVSDLGSEVHHLPRRKRAVSDSLAQRYAVVRDRNATT